MKAIDYIVLVLVIIGAINWGLVGFFGLDLVAFLFWFNVRIVTLILCRNWYLRTLCHQFLWAELTIK